MKPVRRRLRRYIHFHRFNVHLTKRLMDAAVQRGETPVAFVNNTIKEKLARLEEEETARRAGSCPED